MSQLLSGSLSKRRSSLCVDHILWILSPVHGQVSSFLPPSVHVNKGKASVRPQYQMLGFILRSGIAGFHGNPTGFWESPNYGPS